MDWFLLWALAAAMAWGTADFCAKKAADQLGFWPTVWGMNAVGALALALIWVAGGVTLPHAQLGRLLWLGVGNTLGGVLFYYALEFGPLALVSPITAAYPVVSAWLAYWLSGERLTGGVMLAVGGVIAGTLLASFGARAGAATAHPGRRTALAAAVGGALVFGTVFYFLAAGSGTSGVTAPVLVFRFCGALLLAAPLWFGRRLPPALWTNRWVWATGLLDSSAYFFYAVGARALPVSVLSALSGLFTVWTLLLAVLFLRERLARWQWLGVALIISAIALLALA